MIRLIVALCAYLVLVVGQDPDCDFYEKVSRNKTYIQNREYPKNYSGGVKCRWILDCGGDSCKADCDIELPSSRDCSLDKILISRTGDDTLSTADTFCGKGSTSVTSIKNDSKNRLSIGLVTSDQSNGRFICEVSAVSPTTPPSSSCSCGYHKSNRIVGGSETGPNEFPMMVGIVQGEYIHCGGTIIDKRYVVTAAHCMVGANVANLQVFVGGSSLTNMNPPSKLVNIDRYIIHPNYNEDSNTNDVAVLILSEDLTFNGYVGPVCLPFNYEDDTNRKVTALGWGTQAFGGSTSENLEKVTLDVVTDSKCRENGLTPTSSQYCTYTPDKDTCQFDSGGPLLKTNRENGLLYLDGIISLGKYCAVTPALNTKVRSVLDWIVENTPNANYCKKDQILNNNLLKNIL